MSGNQVTVGGLETILEVLDERYEYDANGRITRIQGEGILPRFVLGRAAEGCVWRFGAALEPARVVAVARLAGRELGFPIGGEKPVLPPERLVMIERLLSVENFEYETCREILTREGVGIAELWTIGQVDRVR
jgi:hypothetical protein